MARVECRNEQDLIELLAAGKWPSQCDGELRRHVRDCSVCADVVLVAGSLLDDGNALRPTVSVPAAGTVWWRAQTRARRDRVREAAAPVAVAQAVGALSVLLVVVLLVWVAGAWLGPAVVGLLPGLPSLELGAALPSLDLLQRAELNRWWWVAALALAWAIAAPLALYLADSD